MLEPWAEPDSDNEAAYAAVQHQKRKSVRQNAAEARLYYDSILAEAHGAERTGHGEADDIAVHQPSRKR